MARRTDDRADLRPDALDLAIIEQLQEDGRRSYGKIGEAVGLSEAAARQRVQRLVETEAIKIVAVTDPALMGIKVRATVGIKAEGDLMELAEAVAAIPETDYVVLTAGSFDILAEVQCQDDAHLLEVLNGGIRSIREVRETETFVYLRLQKQTYPWPPT